MLVHGSRDLLGRSYADVTRETSMGAHMQDRHPTRRPARRPAGHRGTVLGTAALSLLLAACGSSKDEAASGGSTLSVVASTNVWGDIAKTVGGNSVTVTSLISQPSQDPHSFEASSKTLLAVSKADVVLENGGGYDDFMHRVLETSSSKAAVLDAVKISGQAAEAGSELNEHVWYDLPSVERSPMRSRGSSVTSGPTKPTGSPHVPPA